MKFLYICNEYPPATTGGIGVLLRGLCEQLVSRGHEVHVVGCYSIPTSTGEQINGVKIHRLSGCSGRAGLFVNRIALYRQISKITEQSPIDLIEAPDFEAPIALLPRRCIKRVVRLHGSHVYFSHERDQNPSRSIGLLERVGLMQADAWISVSEYTARQTKALFKIDRPIHVIHNAPQIPDRFYRKKDYKLRRRAVYFGTLAEKKGVFSLAKAWRIFLGTHPDWMLVVIGRDGQHEKRSVREQMAEMLGQAAASVQFLGPMQNEELLHQLHEFDFAVLPSFSEAFAMAPMEAMALGIPVVCSMLSSGPELIEHGVDGWLADPRDHLQLASLLADVADNTAGRERVGIAGRMKIEQKFSHEAFINKNLMVYRQVLDQGKDPV